MSFPSGQDGTKLKINGRIFILLAFLLLLYVGVPRFKSFSTSLTTVKNAQLNLIFLAGLCVIMTYALAAGVYWLLSVRKLIYARTLLVQASTAFANRVLPAGLGGLTLYVRYLRKAGNNLTQSFAIVATNNLLGSLGHIILLGLIISLGGVNLLEHLHRPSINIGLVAICLAVGLLLLLFLMLYDKSHRRLHNLMADVYTYIYTYKKQPFRLVIALLCSLGITVFYVLALYLCAHSIGFHLSIGKIFIVYTAGVLIGTVTPTPGGLGGVEAGLAAGFIAYGASPASSLAAVLLYRLLTYWIPLVPGFIVFLAVRDSYL